MSDVNIRVNIVSRGAQRSIKALERDAKSLEGTFKDVNVSIKNSFGTLQVFAGNVLAKAFTSLTSSAADFAGGIIDATKTVETLGTQLEVLTGSAGAANKLLDEIQEFSARTPFRLEGLTEASNQLLAFGFEADQIVPKLQEIGDVAAASGSDLQEVALIYGQVAAAGKLTGERLLQLQERAIPIGPALAETLNVAESEIRNLVSRGEVDLATFEKAFASLSAEGGAAFGGIAKQSQTLSGRISTLQDNFFLLQKDIGERLGPALKAGATALTNFIQNLRVDDRFRNFLDALANGIPTAINFVGQAIDAVTRTFNGFKIALEQVDLATANFFGTVAEIILSFQENIRATRDFLNLDTTEIDRSIAKTKAFQDAAIEAANTARKNSEDLRRSQAETSEFIIQSTNSIIKSYKDEVRAQEERAEATVQANDKIVKSEVQKVEKSKELKQAEKELAELTRIEEQDIAAVQADEKLRFIEENLGREEAIKFAARQRELKADGKFQLAKIESEKKLTEAQNKELLEREKRAKAADATRQQNLRSSLNTIATLQGNSNKTLFNIGKAAAISTATIDGIAAVQKALASAPPPFNFAIAALVGVATAANVAKIASQKPPSFQQGGIVAGNSLTGDRVNANLNSGELVLNRNQQAELLGIANGQRAAGGFGGGEIVVHTNVNVDGETIARAVSRQVADGFELGEVV